MWRLTHLMFIAMFVTLLGTLGACTEQEPETVIPPEDQAAGEEREGETTGEMARETQQQQRRAVATLSAKSGSSLEGEASFAKSDGDVRFEVQIENVEPGEHAVHIHETGDCSAPDASSAGDHWNPTGEEHGKWGEETFHLGDIGNIDVGSNGTGTFELETDLWSLDKGSGNSVLGKAVVVHRGADDFTTPPDGAAGERIGCGVITLRGET